MYKFKQDQRVHFNLPIGVEHIGGEGIIVGVATTGAPIIGKTYIVKPTTFYDGSISIPNEDYPFECLVMPEMCIKE